MQEFRTGSFFFFARQKNNVGKRPFLKQSDSASRKRPFSTGLLFDWILLVLILIVSRVDVMVFVLSLEAVGVWECCCMAVENRLATLCFSRSPRATRASRATNFRPSGWWRWAWPKAATATFVALHSTESRQRYSRRSRCWLNDIDTCIAPCCGRVTRLVIHAAGERS